MILSIIEIVFAGFVIWGLFNENKFIALENRICRYIKKRRNAKNGFCKIESIGAHRTNPTHCA